MAKTKKKVTGSLPEALGITDEKASEIVDFVRESVMGDGNVSDSFKEAVEKYEGVELHFALYALGKGSALIEQKIEEITRLFGEK